MSSNIILNLNGSKITNLSPPFLSQNIRLEGLNPTCDCNAVNLVKYLKAIESNVLCNGPRQLEGVSVLDIRLEELVCDSGSTTSTTPIPLRIPTTITTTTTTHDDIIWSVPPAVVTKKTATSISRNNNKNMDKIITHNNRNNNNNQDNHHHPSTNTIDTSAASSSINNNNNGGPKMKVADINNMDNLIIGIVGGVVGLIVLFVVSIVCFVKLSNSSFSDQNEFALPPGGAPSIISVPAYVPSSKCTCSHKSAPHPHHHHHHPSSYGLHPGMLMPSGGYATVRTQNGKLLQSLPANLHQNGNGNGIYGPAYPIALSPAPTHHSGYNNTVGPISLRQQQLMQYQQQQQHQQMYASLPYFSGIHEDYERR